MTRRTAIYHEGSELAAPSIETGLPNLAQVVVDQRRFNALQQVCCVATDEPTTKFIPPAHCKDRLRDRPFHVYDDAFLDIIGPGPTLTLTNHTDGYPLFHEATIWHLETDEMFFCQRQYNMMDPEL
ncbi:hypothetical protein QBC44DRAFT_333375 [Cladorrhinum sp. PSN332]|nr:hypothetical protein QBC44DRAFT_333375 [Cladorrhinum sp. PSN332]